MGRPIAPSPLTPAPCVKCGAPFAPYGVGPPLAKALEWFCATHWSFLPSTQALFAERCRAALED